jgi:DNA-binding CsgD family transcriptional regulator
VGDLILVRALMRSLAFSNSVDDFLQILVTSIMANHRASAACFMQFRRGKLLPLGQFGVSKRETDELSRDEARDPFRKSIIESRNLILRTREEFLNESECLAGSESVLPAPSIILPFETLEAIQGVLWVKFSSPLKSTQLTEADFGVLQLAGELIIAKSLNLPTAGGFHQSTLELSELERRVATLADRGLSNKQIARQIMISESWVKKNLQSAYMKLGISSRLDLRSRLTEFDLDSDRPLLLDFDPKH